MSDITTNTPPKGKEAYCLKGHKSSCANPTQCFCGCHKKPIGKISKADIVGMNAMMNADDKMMITIPARLLKQYVNYRLSALKEALNKGSEE